MRQPSIAVIVATGALCAAASADVLTTTSSKDNTLFETTTGSLSNGEGPHMFVGRTSRFGDRRRGVLAFDVSSIPAGSIINSVSLTLWMSLTSSGVSTMTAHRLTADWGEGASNSGDPGGPGAAAQPNDATWLHAFSPGSFWATAGGDFVAGASASTSVDQANFYTWSGGGMVADVQAWVDGSAGSFGWILIGNEATTGTAKRFSTHENTDPNARPALVVDYTIPAPAGIAAFGVGALALARRRR